MQHTIGHINVQGLDVYDASNSDNLHWLSDVIANDTNTDNNIPLHIYDPSRSVHHPLLQNAKCNNTHYFQIIFLWSVLFSRLPSEKGNIFKTKIVMTQASF